MGRVIGGRPRVAVPWLALGCILVGLVIWWRLQLPGLRQHLVRRVGAPGDPLVRALVSPDWLVQDLDTQDLSYLMGILHYFQFTRLPQAAVPIVWQFASRHQYWPVRGMAIRTLGAEAARGNPWWFQNGRFAKLLVGIALEDPTTRSFALSELVKLKHAGHSQALPRAVLSKLSPLLSSDDRVIVDYVRELLR